MRQKAMGLDSAAKVMSMPKCDEDNKDDGEAVHSLSAMDSHDRPLKN
jgi:hypothetical protein